MAERIKEAREFGDISENSEYDDAKNEQAMLEKQIADLEDKLRAAPGDRRQARRHRRGQRGRTVHVKDQKTDKSTKFNIVGSAEANPAESKLSNESPVGRRCSATSAARRHGAGAARPGPQAQDHQDRALGSVRGARWTTAAPSSSACAPRASTRSRTRSTGVMPVARVHAEHDDLRPARRPTRYRVAGRLAARRGHGGAAFLDVVDRSGKLQVHAARGRPRRGVLRHAHLA